MARFWGKINTGEAGERIERITKSAFKNDVDIAWKREIEKKRDLWRKIKFRLLWWISKQNYLTGRR